MNIIKYLFTCYSWKKSPELYSTFREKHYHYIFFYTVYSGFNKHIPTVPININIVLVYSRFFFLCLTLACTFTLFLSINYTQNTESTCNTGLIAKHNFFLYFFVFVGLVSCLFSVSSSYRAVFQVPICIIIKWYNKYISAPTMQTFPLHKIFLRVYLYLRVC